MKSSSAIYGSAPGEPSIIPENYASRPVDLSGYAKDCAEAEQYARDYGRRRPDVDLVILRTQNVLGPTVRTNMSEYFTLPVVPTGIGFDPRLQLLHEEDAVEALYTALMHDATGIFNIAASGVAYLSQALRRLGKTPLPIPAQLALPAASLLRSLGMVDFPTDQLGLILYGRVIDTRRAREVLGFVPRYSTLETIEDFRDHRMGEFEPEPSDRPTWERELFEYLRKRNVERETV
jgi:UDP-glucose 4-epimerase